MLTMLKNWEGTLTINGVDYKDATSVKETFSGPVHILLHPKQLKPQNERSSDVKEQSQNLTGEIKITVKAYMTKKTEPGDSFDFMQKWNANVPMPLRTMVGTVEKETRGMVYMKLHGMGLRTCTCMRCGRELTNPVSRMYGIGPECMQKLGLVRDITEVEAITEDLVNVEWEGWIIKSAITSQEVV